MDFPVVKVTESAPTARIVFDVAVDKNIQSLINKTQAGACIEIPEGTYAEQLVIVKAVHLRGIGHVVIQGDGARDAVSTSTPCTVLESLNIVQPESKTGYGVAVMSGQLKMVNCTVSSKTLSAVHCAKGSVVEIVESTVKDSSSPGILLSGDAKVSLKEVTLSGNGMAGLLVKDDTVAIMAGCTIENNNAGMVVGEKGSVKLMDCTFSNNTLVAIQGETGGKMLIQRSKLVGSPQGRGIVLRDQATAKLVECEMISCDMGGIEASGQSNIDLANSKIVNSAVNTMICLTESAVMTSNDCHLSGGVTGLLVSGSTNITASNLVIERMKKVAVATEGGHLILKNAEIRDIGEVGAQIVGGIADLQSVKISRSQVCGVHMVQGSKAVFKSVSICECAAWAIQGQEYESAEFEDCMFTGSGIGGIMAHGGRKTSFVACKILRNGKLGCEIASGTLLFNGCEISNNGEAAINLVGGVKATIVKCRVCDNPNAGLSVSGSTVQIKDTSFNRNSKSAITVSDKADVVVDGSSVQGCEFIGVNAKDEGTKLKFVDSVFMKCVDAMTMVATARAKIRLVGCRFMGSKLPHLDVSDYGRCSMKNTDIGKTSGGIGIQVRTGGELKATGCTIHDQTQTGLLAGDGGISTLIGCKLYGCEIAGILAQKGCKLTCTNTEFAGGGKLGVQFQDCIGTVTGCTLRGHSVAGLGILAGTNISYIDNVFEGNGQEVVIMQAGPA